jgi:hypothetical protein
MQRWMLNLIGAALLATPALLAQLGVSNVLGTTGGSSSMDGMSGWLHLSIAAGAYVIKWSPVLVGAFIIYYANRRRG